MSYIKPGVEDVPTWPCGDHKKEVEVMWCCEEGWILHKTAVVKLNCMACDESVEDLPVILPHHSMKIGIYHFILLFDNGLYNPYIHLQCIILVLNLVNCFFKMHNFYILLYGGSLCLHGIA
jgi:hypothetical protein